MDQYSIKFFLYIIAGIIVLPFLIKQANQYDMTKKTEKANEPIIRGIKERWKEEQLKNFSKAIEIYPSRHLLKNKKEWEAMVKKQFEYCNELNNILAEDMQKQYNISEEEWENLKSNGKI